MMQVQQVSSSGKWSWGARLLLVLVVATAGLLVWQALQPWLQRPLQQIVLQTNVPASQKMLLQAQLEGHLSDSFFAADLNQIRLEVESNAWVHNARVSRVWPNRLMVEAEKEVLIARWGGGGYVNHEGEIVPIETGHGAVAEGLPILTGPVSGAWFMSQLYRQMSWLVGREDLAVKRLDMAHRGAIEVELNNGIILLLGRDEVLPRLQRVMKVYHAHIRSQAAAVARIDGRYPHGVSVAWKELDK